MRISLAFVFVLLLKVSFGQNTHIIKVFSQDKPATFFAKKLSYPEHVKDSAQGRREALSLLDKVHSHGYIAASIDSMKADTAHTYIYMYVGEKFEKIVLQNGDVDEHLLNDAGVKSIVLSGKPIRISEALMVKEKLIQQCENTGYPFASVKLDSFGREGDFFSAQLFLEKNELIRYDTIRILGKTKAKRAFLKTYLAIKPGKPYNEANVKRISQRLAGLQFLEPIKGNTVEFVNGKAKVNLFLKDKKSSQFDFLVGLLPGSSGQKLLVTGDAHLDLVSAFGMGEEFYLQWQKLQPQTQTLNLKIVYLYLFGLPLGVNVTFDLFKHDTSYVDINGDYGIQYQLSGSNYLKASLQQKISIITSVDTNFIVQNRRLPPNIDLTSNDFAVQYYLQKLDYKFNPTKGYVLTVEGAAGVRTIKRNNAIVALYDEVGGQYFSHLYDTVHLTAFEFRLGLAIDKYWRLGSRQTIKTSLAGKYFYSATIFQNQEYRLGGINSLRGFDDQSIYTPYYAMGNIEYRFLLSKNSFVSAFVNGAIVKNAPGRNGTFDYPFGFGISAAVETKAGIFGITYAMGRQLGNKINFNSAKIHFGYLNYF